MKKIQLEDRHWKILTEILSKYPYDFYAYGSRVKGKARKLSDLDLCYKNISFEIISNIQDELSDSDLPFFVELVDWNNMRPAFQDNIQKDLIKI